MLIKCSCLGRMGEKKMQKQEGKGERAVFLKDTKKESSRSNINSYTNRYIIKSCSTASWRDDNVGLRSRGVHCRSFCKRNFQCSYSQRLGDMIGDPILLAPAFSSTEPGALPPPPPAAAILEPMAPYLPKGELSPEAGRRAK